MPRLKGGDTQGRPGFTRTLLAGFTVRYPERDGSHGGIRFFFQGGSAKDGSKWGMDYAEADMTADESFALTQVIVGRFHVPPQVIATIGLTFKDVTPEGAYGGAFLTNNTAQYGWRGRVPVPSSVRRAVWESVVRGILADCVSPFEDGEDGLQSDD